jgi:hypothetical protein
VRAHTEIVFAIFELKTAAGTEHHWIEPEQKQKHPEVHAVYPEPFSPMWRFGDDSTWLADTRKVAQPGPGRC